MCQRLCGLSVVAKNLPPARCRVLGRNGGNCGAENGSPPTWAEKAHHDILVKQRDQAHNGFRFAKVHISTDLI